MVTEVKKCGVKAVVVPYENMQEASSVSGIRGCPVKTLYDTVAFLEGKLEQSEFYKEDLDFSDLKGQDELIEAIVLGAAGGHNILMLGEPGCGKTMIA